MDIDCRYGIQQGIELLDVVIGGQLPTSNG
jgi:hypothetical protein